MIITPILLITVLDLINPSYSVRTKSKNVTEKTDDAIKKNLAKHEEVLFEVMKNKSEVKPVTITNVVDTILVPIAAKKVKPAPKMIPPDM